MNVQFKQRVNIKFCVKLGKTATETLQLLRYAYGEEALSRARVFEWHKRFVSGRVSVKDDTRSGRPSSSRNEDNVVRIRDMLREGRTVTVRVLADALNISKSTCHKILREDLGKRNSVPGSSRTHSLTQYQKEARVSICADLLHDSTLVNSITAEGESISTTEKDAKRTATREYRGYSGGCDDGAHSHSERGIHQLLPGLAETLATVY
jgi:ribosomal protein S25